MWICYYSSNTEFLKEVCFSWINYWLEIYETRQQGWLKINWLSLPFFTLEESGIWLNGVNEYTKFSQQIFEAIKHQQREFLEYERVLGVEWALLALASQTHSMAEAVFCLICVLLRSLDEEEEEKEGRLQQDNLQGLSLVHSRDWAWCLIFPLPA